MLAQVLVAFAKFFGQEANRLRDIRCAFLCFLPNHFELRFRVMPALFERLPPISNFRLAEVQTHPQLVSCGS